MDDSRRRLNRSRSHDMQNSKYPVILLTALPAAFLVGGKAYSESDRLGVTQARVEIIAEQLHAFQKDTGRFPTTKEGLRALQEKPRDVDGWRGPYLIPLKRLLDPWGSELRYIIENDGRGAFHCVYSVGPNGIDEFPGGDDIGSDSCGRLFRPTAEVN